MYYINICIEIYNFAIKKYTYVYIYYTIVLVNTIYI